MRLHLLAAALAAYMLWRHGRAARAALARGPAAGRRGAVALHAGTAAVALLLLGASLRFAFR